VLCICQIFFDKWCKIKTQIFFGDIPLIYHLHYILFWQKLNVLVYIRSFLVIKLNNHHLNWTIINYPNLFSNLFFFSPSKSSVKKIFSYEKNVTSFFSFSLNQNRKHVFLTEKTFHLTFHGTRIDPQYTWTYIVHIA